MKKVVIYTTDSCPYFAKSKSLLNKKNINYEVINVGNNDQLREDMVAKAGGRRTVPQIFIDDYHVGGCDDLYEHESQGKLDKLLRE